jgi:hypothetical protein
MATHRLWPSTNGPAAAESDTENYTLGVEFSVSATANFTGWYWWCRTAGTFTFSLYRIDSASTGTLLAQVASVSLAAPLGEWKYQNLAMPVSLVAGQRYRATITSSTNNFYCATSNYWSSGAGSSGITSGILSAPNGSDATGNDQCAFIVGASPAFPTSAFNFTNYWLDVEVTDVSTTKQGAVNGTMSRAGTVTGKRNPVGSASGTVSRSVTIVGKRVAKGSVSGTIQRNVTVVGGTDKFGSVNMVMSRQVTITGKTPVDAPPVPPGNTRSDKEYNYQQWLYEDEDEPLTMLDYFYLNGEDQAKLNRPEQP